MKEWVRWQDLYLLPKWWSISIWCVVILIYLTLAGCTDTYIMGYGLDARSETIYFPLIDDKNQSHKYRMEYNIGIYDEDILYCASHHKWEEVMGVYNMDLDIKQYKVKELPKQW